MKKDDYDYAIEQLANNKGRWPKIADECEVSYSWLCKFANGSIPDASHRKVKKLAEVLRAMSKIRRMH